MMKLSIDKYKFIPIIFVLLTILFNNNSLIVGTSLSNESYAFISLAVYASIFLILTISNGKTVINTKVFIFIIISLLCLLVTSVLNLDFHINHALIAFELLQAAIVVHFVCYEDYIRIYVKAMTVLAVISVVMQLLISIAPSIISFAKVVYNTQNVRFYSFFLYFRSTNEGFRNYGFLSEPGDYQHYLNLALLFFLFFYPETDKKRWIPIALTITVLTTFSPAGMVVCLFIWISYILAYSKNIKKTILVIIGGLLFLVIIFSIESLRNRILDYTVLKLTGAKTNSLEIRISGIMAGIKCFLNSPIWGNGFTKGTEIMRQIMFADGFEYHQTSTTTGFLAFFGLPLALLFTIPYVRAFIPSKKISRLAVLILIFGILFTINNERYVWDLPYYIFVMYGIKLMLLSKERLTEMQQ